MKKFRAALTGLVLGALILQTFAAPAVVRAEDSCRSNAFYGKGFGDVSTSTGDLSFGKQFDSNTQGAQTLTLGPVTPGKTYRLTMVMAMANNATQNLGSTTADANGQITFNLPTSAFTKQSNETPSGSGTTLVKRTLLLDSPKGVCDLWEYQINLPNNGNTCTISISQNTAANPDSNQICDSTCLDSSKELVLHVSDMQVDGNPYNGTAYIDIVPDRSISKLPIPISNGQGSATLGTFASLGDYTAYVNKNKDLLFAEVCNRVFTVNKAVCTPEEQLCANKVPPGQFKICQTINQKLNPKAYADCMECSGDTSSPGNNGKNGIWTALGCLQTDPAKLIPQLLRIAMSVAGGLTLLMLLLGAFRLSISSGDPKAVQEAQEMMTNAIIGLVVVMLSVVLLKIIGVDILGLPGL